MPFIIGKNIYRIGITVLFLTISNFSLAQLDIPPVPSKQTSVYDGAKLLSGSEKSALEQKLINYSDTTSTQIVVATINSLQGEDIAYYATEWAQKWGVGQEKEDNGVFILVAKDDRKLTIQTGYGVEHLLTDALSKRIISNIISPAFKQGNYYEGLDRGTSVIIQILQGEYKQTTQSGNGGSGIPVGFIIFFVMVLFIILSGRNRGGRNRGRRHSDTAQSILEAIILSRAGRGGFGGGGFGGSSGGGFGGGGGFSGGFGGGGFGGGGASGGW